MLAVALGAAFIGAWWEGATLLFLFSLSGALEAVAMARTERKIRNLFQKTPKNAEIAGGWFDAGDGGGGTGERSDYENPTQQNIPNGWSGDRG